MSVYGNIIYKTDTSLSIEDVKIMREAYIETCIAIAEEYESITSIEEGANLDMIKTLRNSKKDFSKACSVCKKAINKKDFKEAKAQIKVMRSILEAGKKEVNKLGNGTAETAVYGFFAGLITFFAKNLIWMVTSIGMIALGNKLEEKGEDMYFDDDWDDDDWDEVYIDDEED